MGNYKEMPEGVREMHYDENEMNAEGQEYAQDLMEKASSAAGYDEGDEDEEEQY